MRDLRDTSWALLTMVQVCQRTISEICDTAWATSNYDSSDCKTKMEYTFIKDQFIEIVLQEIEFQTDITI